MNKNRGVLVEYKDKEGKIQKVVARYSLQEKKINEMGKTVIIPINDKLNEIGEKRMIDTSKLTIVGYVD